MNTIALFRSAWTYDPTKPLGPSGGFGAVFLGTSVIGESVAVKRLHLDAHNVAHREMQIAEDLIGKTFKHVMQVLDAGQDASSDRYYVVMPVASCALDAAIPDGGMDVLEAVGILQQIVEGLSELSHIVHRDIKPANILQHNGAWKIADFGIARFVEDATSSRTLRTFLSPPYGAPEQWRAERSTGATDLYSVGCIGVELLTGRPPFRGPTPDDFHRQHLESPPPKIAVGGPTLQMLISLLLRKNPETRPTRDRVLKLLREAGLEGVAHPTAFSKLRAIGAVDIQRQSEEEARLHAEVAEGTKRSELAAVARIDLRRIAAEFASTAKEAAPTVDVKSNPNGVIIRLGSAELGIRLPSHPVVARELFSRSQWDVVAHAMIEVKQASPHYEWSASLLYMRRDHNEPYRWCEISFFAPFGGSQFAPFFLPINDIDQAVGPGVHTFQAASSVKPIDDEAFPSFVDRWSDLLARAYHGQLQHPSHLPLD